MVAFTYYAHRDKTKAVGREMHLEVLNRTAVKLARGDCQRRECARQDNTIKQVFA